MDKQGSVRCRSTGIGRPLCRMLLGLALIAVSALLLSGCSGSQLAGAASRTAASRSLATQVVSHEQVLLLPPVEGGLAGWCIAIKPGECRSAGVFRGPIVAQAGRGESPPAVRVGIVLTTSEVAAVSVDGGPAIPTHADAALPDHLRVAVVEVRGEAPGFGVPSRLRFTPLDAKGDAIPQALELRGSLVFAISGRRWKKPANGPQGSCQIQASRLGGLVARGGFVAGRVKPDPGLILRPVLSCASTSYSLDNWSLKADVLLDATHPGATPVSLPAMKPLPRHPGVFQAVGGTLGGLGSHGQIVARRIPGAWLVVSEGSGVQQRLTLLEHLRATVHL
jgi:hypothetical protein